LGAWSHTSFGNDDASDFVYEVEEDGVPAVANAFEVVNHFPADGYLEAPDACVALAAAELVAAAVGKPASDFPEQAAALMPKIQNVRALRSEATAAVTRVLNNSELRELWAEADDFGKWRADVENLLERLK
jgi:Domain of unknown function (DUF4259)